MKFIVFNIVVAVALIYLFANRDNGFDLSLPKLGEVTAQAEQVLEPAPGAEPQSNPVAPAAKPKNPFSIIDDSETAAAPPVAEAPVIEAADLAPPDRGASVADAPVIDPADLQSQKIVTPSAPPTAPLDAAVAQRRAEVLGNGPALSVEPAQAAANRRRQLLDLAEEMEYLAAEFAVQ